jgi:hypothetical protein
MNNAVTVLYPDAVEEIGMVPAPQRFPVDPTSKIGGLAATGPSRHLKPSTKIERLTKDVGFLLMATGMVTGMLPPPPGPFDMSLMLIGGVALWPRGLRSLDGWTQRRFPRAHQAGMCFLERFLDDLDRRYPPSQ